VNVRRCEGAEDVWVVDARGRIDAGLTPQLDEQLKTLLAAGHSRLIVDFQRVSYISSSGLKILLIALRAARARSGDVRLCAMNDRVRDVFALSGFYKVFEIYPSEQQAAAAFTRGEAG
jgi:anti-sigma B factor antagonist